MTEEIRPICLYIETCLDRKEGTKDCAKCEHHLNYWTEVMIRDMEKNINRLEQENKELKKENENYKLYGSSTIVAPVNHTNTEYDLLYGQSMLYKSALEEIQKAIKSYDLTVDNGASVDTLYTIRKIINEVLK